MKQFAILGIHPELSIAELETIMGIDIDQNSDHAALFESHEHLPELQNTLGGTQKLGEILGSVKDHQELEKHLRAILLDHETDGKLKFGISVYDLGAPKRTKEIQKYMHKVGIAVKKAVKESGRSVRLVTSKETTLSTVVVTKNKLVETGLELVLLVDQAEIHVGVTKAVQDFEDWSHRDYNRPGRDAKSGMLPPKLARIMINLTGTKPETSYLLDPFCGSGTVLMEASLLNFDNVIGSDISQKAINDTGQNLDWLKAEGYSVADNTLICESATNLTKELEPESVNVIVTEPFLGNPRSGKEKIQNVEHSVQALTELYTSAFAELDKILKSGGTMVIASPIHYVGEQAFPVPTIKILEDLGYNQVRKPLLYKREKQFVGRNILIYKK